MIAFVFYGVRISSRNLLGIVGIVCGVLLIVATSYSGLSIESAMTGDIMFLGASALGASYLVTVERQLLDPVVTAALVCTVSAATIIPWHFAFGTNTVVSAPWQEIVWQMLFQGVLFGSVAFLTVNSAIRLIGSQNVGTLSALVPVIGAACSAVIAGDSIGEVEWLAIAAISISVVVASLSKRTARLRTGPLLSPRMVRPMSRHTQAG